MAEPDKSQDSGKAEDPDKTRKPGDVRWLWQKTVDPAPDDVDKAAFALSVLVGAGLSVWLSVWKGEPAYMSRLERAPRIFLGTLIAFLLYALLSLLVGWIRRRGRKDGE